MARVLELTNGHLSLDFDFDENDAVMNALRSLEGRVEIERDVASALIRTPRTEFVADSDPMGLCLISIDSIGDDLLRAILRRLSGPEVDRT